MKRVLIIGLDGATFDVIQPLVEQGRLPNLAQMMREGAWGTLRSTVPPISPTAWTTFAAGVNPGKHGVYDFVRFQPGTTERVPVPANQHGRPTLWRLFSQAGRRVVVLDVPFTHPPEPVNGVVITGYGTPRTPGTAYTYPADLPQRLNAAGLPSGLGWPEERMDVRPEYVEDWERVMAGRAELCDHFMAQDWDLFMIVFGVTDTLAHNFWHYLEPMHPASRTPQAADYREALSRGYELCDEALGRLMEQAGPDCHTLVMSDHGFGTVRPRQTVFEFLIREGYLRLHGAGGGPTSRVVGWLMSLYNNSAMLRRLVRELRPGQKKNLAQTLAKAGVTPTHDNVDWSRSKVVPSNFGVHLYINRSDRFPDGLVSPGSELAELKGELRAGLLALRDADTDDPVIADVYDSDSLYGPDAVPGAPDLVLEYTNLYDPEAPFTGPTAAAVEGGHTPEGVFLAAGPAVRPDAVDGAALADLTPTALHLAGLPVPSDLDGRALTEVLDPDWLEAHPIESGPPAGRGIAEEESGYSAEEAAAVEEQLRALGYL